MGLKNPIYTRYADDKCIVRGLLYFVSGIGVDVEGSLPGGVCRREGNPGNRIILDGQKASKGKERS